LVQVRPLAVVLVQLRAQLMGGLEQGEGGAGVAGAGCCWQPAEDIPVNEISNTIVY
jgi:hypothetical protein